MCALAVPQTRQRDVALMIAHADVEQQRLRGKEKRAALMGCLASMPDFSMQLKCVGALFHATDPWSEVLHAARGLHDLHARLLHAAQVGGIVTNSQGTVPHAAHGLLGLHARLCLAAQVGGEGAQGSQRAGKHASEGERMCACASVGSWCTKQWARKLRTARE